MNTEDLIKFYEDRIKHLETMLEKSMEMNKTLMDKLAQRPITPLPHPLPSMPYQPWVTPNSPPMGGNCPKCGLKLEGVMGYVCSQPQCPTGLGGVWCNVSE